MKFFVSTGEASGDLHLSYLVKSVKSRYKDVDFVGVAGEKSKKEGVEILQDISELAIMGFTEAIKKYKFLERNRLVAGLTGSLLVTEAAKKSGTSRTVDFALDLGNSVFCLPGKFGAKMSWAMNEYIREGAILVNKLEDFGEELGF